MILRRLAEAVRSQNWSTVGIELLVVVLGIFIGLQVDDWNEARKDVARERYYLERIQAELQLDIAGYADAVDSAIKRRGMGRLLLEALEQPKLASDDPAAFFEALQKAAYTFMPAISDHAFSELRYAGNLGLIRDVNLRTAIADYYARIEEYRQWDYLREDAQLAYYNAFDGILTPRQFEALGYVSPSDDFSADEAIDALERLRRRPRAIELIPRATAHDWAQVSMEQLMRRAESLHESIAQHLR